MKLNRRRLIYQQKQTLKSGINRQPVISTVTEILDPSIFPYCTLIGSFSLVI